MSDFDLWKLKGDSALYVDVINFCLHAAGRETSDVRTKWVDLWEVGYHYKQRSEFLGGYHYILNKLPTLSAVPDIYRARMRVGFGLWPDLQSRWDIKDYSRNHFSPSELRQSVQTALELSDEYVWVYNEQKLSFFPRSNLPDDYLDAIKTARAAVK